MRGTGVVVAGADMGIAAQAIVILAYHQDDLAVRLETDDTIGDMDACLFHAPCPADIRGLVETCLEFNQYRDLLAVARGIHE